MNRTDRLYERLALLEREFAREAVEHLQDWLHKRRHSWLASRALSPGLFAGKKYCDADAARFERGKHEIESLRRKLGEPLSESPVAELRELQIPVSLQKTRERVKQFIETYEA